MVAKIRPECAVDVKLWPIPKITGKAMKPHDADSARRAKWRRLRGKGIRISAISANPTTAPSTVRSKPTSMGSSSSTANFVAVGVEPPTKTAMAATA